ncbi:MAG: PHP domain-containing protein, partial [Kiritimatiellales bacterium]
MTYSKSIHSSADLHVHSKYSDRPSEWFLRRIGSPESFVDPQALYRTCRERGMDYVTITDHNKISGALEIAHLPGTFLSSELTTYFTENNSKVHCLVWGITEKTFRDLDELRPNIY